MDISLLQIFNSGEIISFDEGFARALARVLNDGLARYVIAFMEEVDSLPDPLSEDDPISFIRKGAEYIREFTLPRAKVLVTHEALNTRRFQDRPLYEYLLGISLFDLDRLTPMELRDIHEVLGRVLDDLPNMVDRIEARTKEDYLDFLMQVYNVSNMSRVIRNRLDGNNPFTYNDDLIQSVEVNQALFYSAGETSRYTGLGRVIARKNTLLVALLGCRYVLDCDRRSIGFSDRNLLWGANQWI